MEPARLGLIPDSSLIIARERRVWDVLERVQALQGESENAISAITVLELTHGKTARRGLSQPCGGLSEPLCS